MTEEKLSPADVDVLTKQAAALFDQAANLRNTQVERRDAKGQAEAIMEDAEELARALFKKTEQTFTDAKAALDQATQALNEEIAGLKRVGEMVKLARTVAASLDGLLKVAAKVVPIG